MRENIQDCQGSQSPGWLRTKSDPEKSLSDRTVVLEEGWAPDKISQRWLQFRSDAVQRISEKKNVQTSRLNCIISLPQEKSKGMWYLFIKFGDEFLIKSLCIQLIYTRNITILLHYKLWNVFLAEEREESRLFSPNKSSIFYQHWNIYRTLEHHISCVNRLYLISQASCRAT